MKKLKKLICISTALCIMTGVTAGMTKELTTPLESETISLQAKSSSAKTKKYTLSIESENKKRYSAAEKRMKLVFDTVYSKMAEDYYPDAPKNVTLKIIKAEDGTVAYTQGSTITVNGEYLVKNPQDYDCFTHELMHVVQQYEYAAPLWLQEGIADYARDKYGLNNVHARWSLPKTVTKGQYYTNSYRTSAAFLKWIENKKAKNFVYKINEEIRENGYNDSVWEKLTKKSVDDLWKEYSKYDAMVTVYQHSNYCGKAAALPVGEYDLKALEKLGISNDSISSVKVPKGYRLTIFKNDKFGGESAYIIMDLSYVSDGWNDQISSVKVSIEK